MTATARRLTAAERAKLSTEGVELGEHGVAYVLAPTAGVGATAVIADRAFESQMLGLSTRHLDEISCTPAGAKPLVSQIVELLSTLESEGARLVTCRRGEKEHATLAVLQDGGFRVIECLLTLVRPIGTSVPPMPANISLASHDDAEGCAAIGATAFRFDRFHADPAIESERADALKAAWARNSVLGRADAVFVTRDDAGVVTGFNACLLRGDTAIIDLIAVAPSHQSKGLGCALTVAALAHYAGRAQRMRVGTQSCNIGSLALYQSQGFRIENSALTLHAHLGMEAR